MYTCRLCKGWHETTESGPLVSYAIRHWVHVRCGFQRWGRKFLDRLTPYQIGRLPWKIVEEFGVLDEVKQKTQPVSPVTAG